MISTYNKNWSAVDFNLKTSSKNSLRQICVPNCTFDRVTVNTQWSHTILLLILGPYCKRNYFTSEICRRSDLSPCGLGLFQTTVTCLCEIGESCVAISCTQWNDTPCVLKFVDTLWKATPSVLVKSFSEKHLETRIRHRVVCLCMVCHRMVRAQIIRWQIYITFDHVTANTQWSQLFRRLFYSNLAPYCKRKYFSPRKSRDTFHRFWWNMFHEYFQAREGCFAVCGKVVKCNAGCWTTD